MYRTFVGEDPCEVPMRIFPATHYSMGGLWVDYATDAQTSGMARGSPRNHATSIPGLFACGECDFAYHGANRLGANSLLSASYSGRVAGESVAAYIKNKPTNGALLSSRYDAERARQAQINDTITRRTSGENAFTLHREIGDLMRKYVFVERDNAGLDTALAEIARLKERAQQIALDDRSGWANQSLSWARQVQDMIVLAEVIAKGARLRDECRGSHYKAEFELKVPEGKFAGDPEYEAYKARWKASNEKWMKHTVATHAPDGPQIDYVPIDASVMAPETPRDYR
jgi:succinate dehydrogenase / fumarate reductase flavoprotein subunit